jgi:hypothetical protein
MVALSLIFAVSYINDLKTERSKEQTAFIGERQLLQIVVNASRHFNAGDSLFSNVAIYYPDADLDTSVYSYRLYQDSACAVIIATAKDSNLVPLGRSVIGYKLGSGRSAEVNLLKLH